MRTGVIAAACRRDQFPLVILSISLLFTACLMPAQADTWWHLRAGEEIWKSGRVLLQDQFTHTVAGQRWPDHEWLTQLIFYVAYLIGGLPALTFICAASVTLAWVMVSSLTAGPPLARVAIVGGAAALSCGTWSLRPQVFTMALLAVTLWVLARRRFVWGLPLLFLVWANLHGAVAQGGVLMVAATLSSLIARDGQFKSLFAISVGCFGATLLTPLGVSLWLEMPQMIQRSRDYGLPEWRTPGLHPMDLAFWLTAFGVVALVLLKRRSLFNSTQTLTVTLSTMMFLVFATRSARQIAPFFLCAAPTITALLTLKVEKPSTARDYEIPNLMLLSGSGLAAVAFVAYAWSIQIPRLSWVPVPPALVSAINDCRGPLYNNYDDGGALIWFMKDRKVFMDSRQDPFPRELVFAHIELEKSGDYQALFHRFGIECALTRTESPLAASLRRDGWKERRVGSRWTVYGSLSRAGTGYAREPNT